MTTTTHPNTRPRPQTEEMVIVHACFRRQFGNLPALLQAVPDGDLTRAGVLLDALDELVESLHQHHTNEDELLWPVLLERLAAQPGGPAAAGLDTELVLRMEEQHVRVGAALTRVRELSTRFRASGRSAGGSELAGKLEELNVVLNEHLAEEESRILPLCEEFLTVEEWNRLGEAGVASMPKDRLLVQIGWLLDSATPEQAQLFTRLLPWPARVLYRLVGRRRFAAEYREIYGVDPA